MMKYRRCGNSGVLLSEISLGLWHNFGDIDSPSNARAMVLQAYERGVTHFDLANNYGPTPGSAESTFGTILRRDLASHRNRLLISSKAGHLMWDGPYGDWASRKHLIASCDESLSRLGLDYLDVFYSHRHDPLTPLEETMSALDHIVRSGRALYVGLSAYPVDMERRAIEILRSLGTPVLVDQLRYSMLDRKAEQGHFELHNSQKIGCVTFSPLAQGQLSDKYLDGQISQSSRAGKVHGYLQPTTVANNLEKVRQLNEIAIRRGQTLSSMAISWQLRLDGITSVIVGASSVEQINQNIDASVFEPFTDDQISQIDAITL